MTPWRCPLCAAASIRAANTVPDAAIGEQDSEPLEVTESTHELRLESTSPTSKSYRCEAGHCFDIAREGYVNLLPVQQKKSLSPGDTIESLQARRRFLDGGFYQPLRDALTEVITPCQTLIDLGCGEGYYTAALNDVACEVIALDIAKPAIRMAAKTYPALRKCRRRAASRCQCRCHHQYFRASPACGDATFAEAGRAGGRCHASACAFI